jgi:NAD(P)-dependent dehydrogenase (short-subunit alcohol dehydrogenase family)
MKLKDKVAIVTGAASGMGEAIALLFAREGAKVIVSDINLKGAERVVQEIKDGGGEATAILTDVSKQEDVDKMIEAVVSNYGTLDILVNNAGIMDNFMPAGEVSDRLWDKVFAVNVKGPMMAIRKALGIFADKESGNIINIASLGGIRGSRAGAAYTASKHAIVGLTKNVGFQYAKKGIRCNAIAPGAVETSIGDTITEPSQFGMERATLGQNLNPRAGKSEEIAAVALFLASQDSSFVNGAVVIADGGWGAY